MPAAGRRRAPRSSARAVRRVRSGDRLTRPASAPIARASSNEHSSSHGAPVAAHRQAVRGVAFDPQAPRGQPEPGPSRSAGSSGVGRWASGTGRSLSGHRCRTRRSARPSARPAIAAARGAVESRDRARRRRSVRDRARRRVDPPRIASGAGSPRLVARPVDPPRDPPPSRRRRRGACVARDRARRHRARVRRRCATASSPSTGSRRSAPRRQRLRSPTGRRRSTSRAWPSADPRQAEPGRRSRRRDALGAAARRAADAGEDRVGRRPSTTSGSSGRADRAGHEGRAGPWSGPRPAPDRGQGRAAEPTVSRGECRLTWGRVGSDSAERVARSRYSRTRRVRGLSERGRAPGESDADSGEGWGAT